MMQVAVAEGLMAAAQTSGFEQVMQEQLSKTGLLVATRSMQRGSSFRGVDDGDDEDGVEYSVPDDAGHLHASALLAAVSTWMLQLRRILAAGAALQRSPSLDSASVLLTTETTEILQCERASLFLFDR